MRQDSTRAYRSSMPALATIGSEIEVGAPAAAEHEFCASREQGRTRVHVSGDEFHRMPAGQHDLKIPDFG